MLLEFEILVETVMKSLKILQQPALAAVVLWVLLIHDSNLAMAASGGRMGGNAFSSPSSSSSSNSEITSYSTPRRPALVDYEEIDYYSMRRQQPCCIHRNDIHASSSFIPSHSGTRDGHIVGIAAVFAAMICFGVFIYEADRSKNKTSVLMLQVGLLDSDISLQKELNGIAEVIDTSTKQFVDRLMSKGAWMKVTILVAAEGVYKLPTVNGRGDLKEALQNLASILSKKKTGS